MLWSCSAIVHLEKPMDVPGFPPHTRISESCKVRTEGDKERSSKEIIEAIRLKMDTCYGVPIKDITDATVDFTL